VNQIRYPDGIHIVMDRVTLTMARQTESDTDAGSPSSYVPPELSRYGSIEVRTHGNSGSGSDGNGRKPPGGGGGPPDKPPGQE
jgi:hypothetical protein